MPGRGDRGAPAALHVRTQRAGEPFRLPVRRQLPGRAGPPAHGDAVAVLPAAAGRAAAAEPGRAGPAPDRAVLPARGRHPAARPVPLPRHRLLRPVRQLPRPRRGREAAGAGRTAPDRAVALSTVDGRGRFPGRAGPARPGRAAGRLGRHARGRALLPRRSGRVGLPAAGRAARRGAGRTGRPGRAGRPGQRQGRHASPAGSPRSASRCRTPTRSSCRSSRIPPTRTGPGRTWSAPRRTPWPACARTPRCSMWTIPPAIPTRRRPATPRRSPPAGGWAGSTSSTSCWSWSPSTAGRPGPTAAPASAPGTPRRPPSPSPAASSRSRPVPTTWPTRSRRCWNGAPTACHRRLWTVWPTSPATPSAWWSRGRCTGRRPAPAGRTWPTRSGAAWVALALHDRGSRPRPDVRAVGADRREMLGREAGAALRAVVDGDDLIRILAIVRDQSLAVDPADLRDGAARAARSGRGDLAAAYELAAGRRRCWTVWWTAWSAPTPTSCGRPSPRRCATGWSTGTGPGRRGSGRTCSPRTGGGTPSSGWRSPRRWST